MFYEEVSNPEQRMLGSHRLEPTLNKKSVVKIKQTQTISVQVDCHL